MKKFLIFGLLFSLSIKSHPLSGVFSFLREKQEVLPWWKELKTHAQVADQQEIDTIYKTAFDEFKDIANKKYKEVLVEAWHPYTLIVTQFKDPDEYNKIQQRYNEGYEFIKQLNQKDAYDTFRNTIPSFCNPFFLARFLSLSYGEYRFVKTEKCREQVIAERTIRVKALQRQLNEHYFLPLQACFY